MSADGHEGRLVHRHHARAVVPPGEPRYVNLTTIYMRLIFIDTEASARITGTPVLLIVGIV